MFEKILKFFFDDTQKSISFYKLYTLLVKWGNEGRLPYAYELPESVSFDEGFWREVVKLYRLTEADGFERAVSVYWVDGELVVTDVTKGNRREVTTRSNIRVSYDPTSRREYFKRSIFVNEGLYSTKEVYYKNMPKVIDIKYLFNMHTHPSHDLDGRKYYNTFSATDVKSLVDSSAKLTGLITDEMIIMFKTSESKGSTNRIEDRDISLDTLTTRYGFVVFKGRFNEKLVRFSSHLAKNNSTTSN